METKRGILVLADISGYTRFTRMHHTSLLHAEEIISELLEAVIRAADFPLQVSQLEGDAVLLFAEVAAGREREAALDVARQVRQLFSAFDRRERALISCDAGCVCDACNQIGQLRLKAVLHFGEFSRKRVGRIETLVGTDVKLLRRLIKTPALSPEFVLFTQPFHALSGDLETRPPDRRLQLATPEGDVPVLVYFPPLDAAGVIDLPPGSGPALSARLNRHSFARMFGLKPRAQFYNLAHGERSNLVRYILEGTQSGMNLLRKALRRKSIEIRPVALLLLEISADSQPGLLEELNSGLLQAVIDSARAPLRLNKLEGDAALMVALAENGEVSAARNTLGQARGFFETFRAHTAALAEDPARPAALRAAARGLRLRVLLHFGRAAFKRVGNFDEIAGEDVILIHRLLKNSVPAREYILMTKAFHRLAGSPEGAEARIETAEGIGQVPVRVFPLSGE